MSNKVQKTDKEWKSELTDEQYRVCRQKGTERAFAGEFCDSKDKGLYKCVCCGNDLFDSETKFDSGTGWPSFWKPVTPQNVKGKEDLSHGMNRIEAVCGDCGAHLGHVFPDGPAPTNLRFCINSVALKLEKGDGD